MRYFESLDDFYNECFNHNSIKELCETLHIGRTTINKYLRDLRAQNPEDYNKLKIFWKEKYNDACAIRASNNPIPKRAKYDLNDKSFDEVNPESAYWLGFLASDGCVHKKKHKISIGLQIQDKEHLEKFAKFLSYSGEIKTRNAKARDKRYPIAYLEIHSKYMKNKLSEYGIVPAKSNLDIDYLSYIPDEFQLDFIFGYLDGDGSIYLEPSNTKLSIIGNNLFIKHTQKMIMDKLDISSTIYKDNRLSVPKYQFQVHKHIDIFKFLTEYLKHPSILIRKKNISQNWILHNKNNPKERKLRTVKNKYCPICGKQIQHESNHCVECAKIVSRKVERPTKEELSNLILQYPITKIGEIHGVSDNAVRKWLKSYDLPVKSADIKAFRELHKQSQEESSV